MQHDSAAVIRTRAELARRLAHELHNERARRELLQIADDLEAEADKMDKEILTMEIDGERYSKALELLRAALEICLTLMDTEVDRETLVKLGGVVAEIEAAITAIEAERRAIPMREG